jgi:hypothetical protein
VRNIRPLFHKRGLQTRFGIVFKTAKRAWTNIAAQRHLQLLFVCLQLLNSGALPLAFVSELRIAALQPGGCLPEILHILRKQSAATLLVVKLLLKQSLRIFGFSGSGGGGISGGSGSDCFEFIGLTGFFGVKAPLRLQAAFTHILHHAMLLIEITFGAASARSRLA